MTDSVRESAQEPQAPQAPRRNVAAKTSLATDLSLIAVFAGFIAALAIMPAVSLGGVAVPFTFQTLGIYITAQVLGGKRATASVALYLLVGFAGLPIFAKGGAGLGTLASPSAGYLLGFLPFAAIAGTLAYLFTRNTRSVGATFLMALVANFCGFVVLTACGIAGMMVNAHMTFDAAFSAAMVFVPWDLVKSTIAVLVGLSVRRAFPSLASTRR